jgi:hypothetical protein
MVEYLLSTGEVLGSSALEKKKHFKLSTSNSQKGNFAPQETFGSTWRHFGLSLLGEGVLSRCYWQIVGSNQGCL